MNLRIIAAGKFLACDENQVKEQLKILDDHEGEYIPDGVDVWTPFQDDTADILKDNIDSETHRLEELREDILSEAITKLVDMALDDTLPMDISSLDVHQLISNDN